MAANFWEDLTLRYIVIGSVSGIALLACIIITLCIVIVCLLSTRSHNKPKIIDNNFNENHGKL